MHLCPLYVHSKQVSFSFDLKQLRSYQRRLIHHTFFVHFASIAFNDRELVWEWWVRNRCVNDWYIVAEVLE